MPRVHELRCEEKLFMNWYILYKGKAKKNSLRENLDKVGINYFIPTSYVEYYEDGEMKVREDQVLKNLIFIQTDKEILDVANSTDGLKHPYIDHTTHKPAYVSDNEMQRFMLFVKARNINATVLPDLYSRFKTCQKVRVKAGDFVGTEGRVLRIRGDRKLVISLGEMAVAISGIHHTLLEPIE